MEVAREQAAVRGFEATFALGEAAALPIEDGDADVVVSVFGVIFAPNAPAAVAEMARVSAPAGRIVLSAWVPEGAIHEAVRVAQAAVRRAVGAPLGPPPFAWPDSDALAVLFGPYGFEVTVEEEHQPFTATRRANIWMWSPPTTRLRSPAAPCLSSMARARRCATACCRSTRQPTRIRTASASRAATSLPSIAVFSSDLITEIPHSGRV